MTPEQRIDLLKRMLDDMTYSHQEITRRLTKAHEDRELLRELAQSLQTQRSWCVVALVVVAALILAAHGGSV